MIEKNTCVGDLIALLERLGEPYDGERTQILDCEGDVTTIQKEISDLRNYGVYGVCGDYQIRGEEIVEVCGGGVTHILYSLTPEEIIEEVEGMDTLDIVSEVENWDFEDVYELKDYLEELKSRGEIQQVDMTSLPCAEKYLDRVNTLTESQYVTIWTCDRHGRCLCGPAADDVKYIDELEEDTKGE